MEPLQYVRNGHLLFFYFGGWIKVLEGSVLAEGPLPHLLTAVLLCLYITEREQANRGASSGLSSASH